MSPRTSILLARAAAIAAIAAIVSVFEFSEPIEAHPPAIERSMEDIEAAEQSSQRFIEALACGGEQRWKAIHWSSSVAAALRAARESGKPLLLLLSVREIGTQDPGRC